jgi:hypothetical protein
MMRRWSSGLVAALVAIAVLAACGGDEDGAAGTAAAADTCEALAAEAADLLARLFELSTSIDPAMIESGDDPPAALDELDEIDETFAVIDERKPELGCADDDFDALTCERLLDQDATGDGAGPAAGC